MHIPDGYLSPSTCAALYASATPFWYVALRRVERVLHTRMVPLLALFSAFSFVIMMFNLPLPGGTTGHAVGVGVAAVVLGPWAAMLAISMALFIQAIFFGDGGVTAFGANCFNMAIVGSLVAHGSYRLAAGRSSISSPRRVSAAALAGYAAINVSALLTAIELGIQPALFHDAANAPLYAPYPLRIAIPAMMVGHLTIAGIAEAVISGGIVSYLQSAEPSLLAMIGRGRDGRGAGVGHIEGIGVWRTTRGLWASVALLMLLTPLGLLAAGVAWGEWAASDYSNPAMRQQMAAASGSSAPPIEAPRGLARLAEVWTAPMPGYAPHVMRSEAFGYVMSAMVGVALIILSFLLLGWIAERLRPPAVRR
jgi:cobalt/nickel transport system permease protein